MLKFLQNLFCKIFNYSNGRQKYQIKQYQRPIDAMKKNANYNAKILEMLMDSY